MEKTNHDPVYYNNIGHAAMMKGKYDKALEYFETAFAILAKKDNGNPKLDIYLWENFLACLYNMNNLRRLKQECQKTLDIQNLNIPLYQSAYRWLGEAALKEFDYNIAYLNLKMAESIKPDDFDIKMALADYYEAKGEHTAAREYCLQAISLNRKEGMAWFTLGMNYIFDGNQEEGKRCLMRSYILDPRQNCTKGNLLRCMIELGELPLLTNCDEEDFVDDLMENGKGDRIIRQAIGKDKVSRFQRELEDWYYGEYN